MRYAYILIATLLLLAACTAEQPVRRATMPALPPTIPVIETATDAAETPVDQPPLATAYAASETRDLLFGTRKDGSLALDAEDIGCSIRDRTLRFTITNTDTRSWQLDNELPLAPPEGLVGVHVLLNQYNVNTRTYIRDGARLFGPNEQFSENCNGIAILTPGERVTCTLTNVPLHDIYHAGGVNKLLLNVPGAAEDPKADFLCAPESI